MKIMKKMTVRIVFLLVFSLILCACDSAANINIDKGDGDTKNDAATQQPTEKNTEASTQNPTEGPTQNPTEAPTQKPTTPPTEKPTEMPTEHSHEYGDWVVRQEASCTENGIKIQECACGDSKSEVIHATGHTLGADATCTTAQICTVCGTELTPMLGHIPANAVEENRVEHTCTGQGSYDTVIYCSVCNVEISRENANIPATGHTLGADATCTTAQTCTVCNAEIAPALGHDYNEENTCTRCADYKDKGMRFEYSSSSNSYRVAEYTGNETVVVIPSTYNGKPVTSINGCVFWECRSLTSIEIPDSITSIGGGAFHLCDSLVSVVFGENSQLTSIGDEAFYGCSSLASIIIPDSVTSIGDAVFWECRSLTSIEIPDSITSIGDWAFYECRSLTSVVIGENSQLTSIGDGAFYLCDSLASIEISDSVTSIGDSAFYWCSSLTSIIIPDSVTSIGSWAFSCCSSLNSITVDDNNTVYKSINGSLYSKDGKTLIQYAIGKTDTAFTIPSDVTSIGVSAFANGNRLTSIIIPDSVTSIGSGAFENCYNLTIYCEAASKPSGWSSNWNYSNCHVVWGYCEHVPGAEATCTTAQICIVCEAELTPALGHNYSATVIAPTCTEKGFTKYMCTVCNDEYISDETNALGHTPGAEPTATTAQVCTACGIELAPSLGEDSTEQPGEEPTDKPTEPESKPKKYFTLSFDDGITQDLKIIEILKKYNVDCCSFNINTGLYGANWTWVGEALHVPTLTHIRFTEEELRTGIYDGFDVLVHTKTHPSLKNCSLKQLKDEIIGDADNIESITGVRPVGMAWPGGDTEFNLTNIRNILRYTDIRFARCTTPTYTFDLPEKFMTWYPTCSFSDARLFELAQQFIDAEPTEDMLFYVWGHGYEMDIPGVNSYEEFEQLIKMISEADDIVLVTNTEFYELYKDQIESY